MQIRHAIHHPVPGRNHRAIAQVKVASQIGFFLKSVFHVACTASPSWLLPSFLPNRWNMQHTLSWCCFVHAMLLMLPCLISTQGRVLKVGRRERSEWRDWRAYAVPHLHGSNLLSAPYPHGRGQGEAPEHRACAPAHAATSGGQEAVRRCQVWGDGARLHPRPRRRCQPPRAAVHAQRLLPNAHLPVVRAGGERDPKAG
jgi:hypothetical protein